MGDRCNVVFNTKGLKKETTLAEAMEGQIVLYSHWGGYDLGNDLRDALIHSQKRWNDFSYGIRMMVCHLTKDATLQETGYGLSVGQLCDNERPIAVIDMKNREVVFYKEDMASTPRDGYTFLDFLELDEKQARIAHLGRGLEDEE